MTVFQYLQTMPQPLIEATLLGLMGFPINPEREEWIHKWMNEPHDKWFPKTTLSTLTGDMTVPLDHMTMLLGKTAETLPRDKQEKLSVTTLIINLQSSNVWKGSDYQWKRRSLQQQLQVLWITTTIWPEAPTTCLSGFPKSRMLGMVMTF